MQNGFSLRGIGQKHAPRAPMNRPAFGLRTSDFGQRVTYHVKAFVRWSRARGRKRLLRDTAIGFAGFLVLYGGFLWITLPDISDPRSLIAAQSSVIVDRNGTELYRLYREEDRTFILKEQIPDALRQAIVAIEDERFFNRGCLDVQALARVFFRFGRAGGASTLTRQLARNALDLKRENIVNRKIKELILGCQLEARYSKDELLNLYLNWIPFGQNAYGIEQASQSYFSIPAKDLTLAQAAALAALPQRPSYFSPFGSHVRTKVSEEAYEKILTGNITKAADLDDDDVIVGLLGARAGTGATTIYVGGRSDQVLRKMQDLGSITENERLEALAAMETMTFKRARETIRAAHFVLWVKQQVQEMIGEGAEEGILDQGGLVIETTLDWNLQQAAEQAIASRTDDMARIYEIRNAALVAVDPATGDILAYVGNSDYADEEHDGKVDMARAPRQPGSSFKPFVYAAAFEKGYGPATVLFDVPTKIGDDEPQNFDGSFWGLMPIRRALGASRNIPAAKAFFLAGGEGTVLDMASRLGAVTPLKTKIERLQREPDFEYGWPLALGTAETPLLEMVRGYATLASGGTSRPLRALLRIKDRRGNIIFETKNEDEELQALDPRIAYQVTSILSDVSARPNEYWQSILTVPGVQAAAKTGTSNKCLERKDAKDPSDARQQPCTKRKPSDLWTLGYTPTLVAGVWVGNADATPLADKAESLTNAAPIWKEFMTKARALRTEGPTSFAMPSGLVQPLVSRLSGELPTECTPVEQRGGDVFLEERAPNKPDPACARLEVDRVTGLLASDECPAEAREEKSFLVPQTILADRFPQWQQAVLAWAQKSSASGSALPLPLAPTETCTLALTPGRLEKPRIFLEFPQDGDGVGYPSFRPRIDVRVGSSIREIRYEIDGKLVERIASGATLDTALRAPRSVDKSGPHRLRVTVVDQYFNTASAESSFRFEEDDDRPSVRFVRPESDITITSGASLEAEVDAEDAQGGIKYVEFYLNERLLTRKPKEPYALTYDADLKPGTYQLRAVATDFAGNESEDTITVTVEP